MHALDTQYALERSAINPGSILRPVAPTAASLVATPFFHSYLNVLGNEMAMTSAVRNQ
jgi:hypothetical protein